MNQTLDVLVVGGGLVGASLTLALLQQGFHTGLIEAKKAQPIEPVDFSRPGFDHRVFAISRASEHIFRALGVWEAMCAQRVSPYQAMQVWESFGEIGFDHQDIGQENLGHIIELQVIQYALQQRQQDFPQLHGYFETKVSHLQQHEDYLAVHLDTGEVLTTRLLVGADGGDSQIRKLAGISCDIQPYGHHALVASIETALPHQATARQRFLPSGPLAFLPLTQPHTSSIVWSLPPEQAAAMQALDKPAFHQALEQAFNSRLGSVLESSELFAFPLRRRHAKPYVKPRIALVGDAVRSIHPLAGQGVNMGLLDAASLFDVIVQAQTKHRDIGALETLQHYQRWRKGENLKILLAMDGFKNLFGNSWLPLRWARNIGMRLTDAAYPLKNKLMQQAMGLEGDLPRLAR
ncbi:UbiH/UbiF/VisC/COQ6 family ubiquinone biosynthesis hydroxylase [Candidatus Venteria ishoeyi]|uniref:UbiH/UbiF/VisC/COQ6 family ubiquinone biosynthesis hydroxylase n=1 Tax=Candidatus Venteria ishoeyi TaxID=1899563 RepID=UPI0025A5453F|nr:UbiH/UbiF/VisC/COQ6 family ubiquinone biosynthesis hydroxylase [Candidatus Venteria ishoeyi]MDM8545872.1 UbiH/UbiF/VisC/COQ6 family ubiquinone biosynthesis hydroxylase [Candidatus Venteria ishoeyi]